MSLELKTVASKLESFKTTTSLSDPPDEPPPLPELDPEEDEFLPDLVRALT